MMFSSHWPHTPYAGNRDGMRLDDDDDLDDDDVEEDEDDEEDEDEEEEDADESGETWKVLS